MSLTVLWYWPLQVVWCILFTLPVGSLCHVGQAYLLIFESYHDLKNPDWPFNILWVATHLPLLHQHHYRCCIKLYSSSSSGCDTTGAPSTTSSTAFSIEIRFNWEEQVMSKENEITAWIPELNEWISSQLKQFSTARPFLVWILCHLWYLSPHFQVCLRCLEELFLLLNCLSFMTLWNHKDK